MKYITLADLSQTIRKNIYKIPRNIDMIIGIPRSGMIAASIISSYMNVPLIDANSFIDGKEPWGGNRLCYFNKNKKSNRILVVDDTVANGLAMSTVKKKLSSIKDIKFIYMCVYLEGRGENAVDIYLDDVRKYTDNFINSVLYEWNIFQHNEGTMKKFLFDIDGVFCLEPPDEKNEKEYIDYIKNATPLFIPRTKIGGIVTYRLIKNKEITEEWLKSQDIKYDQLIMFPANTWDERHNLGVAPEVFKGQIYKKVNQYTLFIESDDNQARKIAQLSGKPVYCVETNKMY